MAAVRGYYATIKNLFPPCSLVFAYGSAALPQHGVPMVYGITFVKFAGVVYIHSIAL